MANVVEYRIKGIDDASGAFKSVGSAIAGVGKTIVKAGAVMATALTAGAGAAFSLSSRVADAQDRVGKMSDRLGIAVDKLSQFHHAAELGGIRTQTFDMALQRMSRRVAEAGQGMGEAQGALRELGIDAEALSNLPLDQQMNVVADALNGVDGQANKVRLAFKLFDSEGVSMLQTMKNGSQSFKDAATDLERLGGVMTAQGTANAAKFKDEWSRVRTAISGVSMGVANQLIPMFTGLFQKLTDWIVDIRPKVVSFVSGAIRQFFVFGAVVGQIFEQVMNFGRNLFDFKSFESTFNSIIDGAKNLLTNIFMLIHNAGPPLLAAFSGIFVAAFKTVVELARNFGIFFWQSIFDIATGQDVGMRFSTVIKKSLEAGASELGVVNLAFKDFADIAIESGSAASEAIKTTFGVNMEAANAQADAAVEKLTKLGQLSEDVLNNIETKGSTFQSKLTESLSTFVMTNEEMTLNFVDNLSNVMHNAVASIGSGIADIIVDGKNAAEVFKNIAKTVVKQLISSYITMKIQRLLFAKTEAGTSVALTGVNALMSMAAAPFPLNTFAPAFAASMQAIAAGLAAPVMGAVHGGLENVPTESTFLLQRGERVLSPNQNRDLTDFLQNQNTGVGEVTVNVFTTASTFNDISPADVQEFVAGKVIPAMDRLDRQGIRPVAIERAIT